MKNFLSLLALSLFIGLSLFSSAEALNLISEESEFEEDILNQIELLRSDPFLNVDHVSAHEQDDVYEAVAVSTTTPPDLSQQTSNDSSIVLGARTGAPFTDQCDGRSHYGALSHQRGNSFCYGPAPKGYKATIDPYLCQNMDQYFRTCPPFGNGVTGKKEDCGMTSGVTWGPPGKPSTTAWGTWTSWWKGLSAFCMKEGYWSDSDASRLPDVNSKATIKFTIAASDGEKTYRSEQKKNDSQEIVVEGDFDTSGGTAARTLTSPSFNSPFIYLTNQVGAVAVQLNSLWNQYQSQSPAFNLKNGWLVDNDSPSPLFYELGLTQVELSRAGMNFQSKEALEKFLTTGDFFDRLGFTALEKNNSLGYLLPRLPESPHYYLTILDSGSVSQLSSMSVDPRPETLVRRYFAVYPTQVPVHASGELDYPGLVSDVGFTVRDYGEIIVTPDMFVIWK